MNDSVKQQQGRGHRGPPLVVVAAVSTALFVASVVVTTLMAHGAHFPSPFDDPGAAREWFSSNASALRIGAFLQFASAIPLGIFAASAVSRVQYLGGNVAGTVIALYGGVAASVLAMISALTQWVLVQPGVVESGTVRALHLFAFATGGPGYVVPFGLLLAGIAVPAGILRLVPRAAMWIGIGLAAIAELATLSLVLPGMVVALPIARFLGFAWIIYVGAKLPTSRKQARASAAGDALPPSAGAEGSMTLARG